MIMFLRRLTFFFRIIDHTAQVMKVAWFVGGGRRSSQVVDWSGKRKSSTAIILVLLHYIMRNFHGITVFASRFLLPAYIMRKTFKSTECYSKIIVSFLGRIGNRRFCRDALIPSLIFDFPWLITIGFEAFLGLFLLSRGKTGVLGFLRDIFSATSG